MILVDSSVWIAHLRSEEPELAEALRAGDVLMHPFVCGEIACGNLTDRTALIRRLQRIPGAPVARRPQILKFIESHGLMGRGIGYVDMHLLASAVQSDPYFWTRDRRSGAAANQLHIHYTARR